MKAVVVYESMYGNTHLIADAIGEGVGTAHTVHVVPVAKATRELVDRADLVVVGGPETRPFSTSIASGPKKRPSENGSIFSGYPFFGFSIFGLGFLINHFASGP